MKTFYLLLMVLLTIQNVVECKRTLSGGGSKTSSSNSNNYSARRTDKNTHSYATTRPVTSRPATTRPATNSKIYDKPSQSSGSTGIPHRQPTYYQPGHVPAGATMYHHPKPMAPPTYYSPGRLPPGAVLYPAKQAPKSSGPGFGTGLVAGAIGGAILDRALTNRHHDRVYHEHHYHTSNAAAPATDTDRIIIINNGQPGAVTTNSDGTTIINNGGGTQAASAAVATGAALESTSNTNAPPAPAPGSIACYPIMVNQTNPSDPTEVTEVEQMACYEVPANPEPPPQQLDQTQQPHPEIKTAMSQPSSSRTEIIIRKSSSASLAESSQIKQNGTQNNKPTSFWTAVTFAIFISCSKLLMN